MMISRTPKNRTLAVAAIAGAAALGVGTITAGSGSAQMAAAPTQGVAIAKLDPVNNAAGSGRSTVTVDGRRIDVRVDAKRLLRGQPHAQHIHFGQKARNECPTVRDDDNADHRINTAEGQPAYGPVRVSLTTRGDTSADSTLAVDRFPEAKAKGRYDYSRDGIRTSRRVARAIAAGEAVVVVHGIDYNDNGTYDFEAGRSELDPALPAEATDPALCGVLEMEPTDPSEAPSEDPTEPGDPSESPSDDPSLPIDPVPVP